MKLNPLETFSKSNHISNLRKIRPYEVKFFDADVLKDRQTNVKKPIFAIRNFSNVPKNL